MTPKSEYKLQFWQVKQRQSMPLWMKIEYTKKRVKSWYNQYEGKVYIAFSGGKDSTVLLHIVRSLYPDVPAVFVDTGLEYPEIRSFVKTFDNVTWLKPSKTFKQVLDDNGYPIISKSISNAVERILSPGTSERVRYKAMYGDEKGSYGKLPNKWRFLLDAPFKISDRCCDVMKMRPVKKYAKTHHRVGIVGTMACDSNKRMTQYLKHGCNIMNKGLPKCVPISFWNTEDIWQYIKTNKIDYCSIYDTGVLHTGCVFCMFGIHMEQIPNRFQRMEISHPKLHKYCMEKLGLVDVLDYLDIPYSNSPTKLDILLDKFFPTK